MEDPERLSYLDVAKDADIVMFGESHDDPALVFDVLARLSALRQFNYLALEFPPGPAFDAINRGIINADVVKFADSVPTYALLAIAAKRYGFAARGIEGRPLSWLTERELAYRAGDEEWIKRIEQAGHDVLADNLGDIWLEDPSAKVVSVVGLSHVDKTNDNGTLSTAAKLQRSHRVVTVSTTGV